MPKAKFYVMRLVLSFALLVSLMSLQAQEISHKTFPSPTPEIHGQFLLNKWDERKPVVVSFKDPRCPYCVKAFKNKEVLDNYNVFVFWAPILGNTSKRQVDTFFKCEQPMGKEVIASVVARTQIQCEQPTNSDLRDINDAMVEAYEPRSVPQYWYGNQKTWITNLKLAMTNAQRLNELANRSSLKIPWNRYDKYLVNEATDSKLNLGLVLDRTMSDVEKQVKIDALAKKFNLFIFNTLESEDRVAEFLVLNNIDKVDHDIYVLEGKRLSNDEQTWLKSTH